MSAYYNENNPYAAQWLRNLIAAGQIARGEVDERSIADVRPSDLRPYRQCHFFAGIGGWAYALRLAGWDDARPVWTGSCPCQPFSVAGRGKAADDERHLWPAWVALIRECRPATILGEQVEAAIGWGWLDAVFADLEAEGYACGAAVLPACSVGAPHRRQRLWLVADDAGAGWSAQPQRHARANGRPPAEFGRLCNVGELADAGGGGRREQSPIATAARDGESGYSHDGGRVGELADTADSRREFVARIGRIPSKEIGREPVPEFSLDGQARELADADDTRSQGRGFDAGEYTGQRAFGETSTWRGYAEYSGIDGTGAGRGRECGYSSASAAVGRSGHSPWSDLIWLPCTDGKARPTKPGLQPLAHGVSARVGKLRAAGNAIVPQVAAEFIKAASG